MTALAAQRPKSYNKSLPHLDFRSGPAFAAFFLASSTPANPQGSIPLPSLLEFVTGALAGRYPIERELGRGGMATVYLARDPRHGRLVALKVLWPELAATLGSGRFLREIQVAAQLTHPHILALYDSGESEGLLYYVMPYIEGESLRERLSRETRLPTAEAVKIGREVADALDYAHSRGVIHRDIKPENILLGAGHAIVADFRYCPRAERRRRFQRDRRRVDHRDAEPT